MLFIFVLQSVRWCYIVLYKQGVVAIKIILKSGSSVPIYEQIKEAIKENILEGTLEGGAQLPSVRVLSKELKVSILTVKKAYDQLEEEGFIEIRQGLGTFVGLDNEVLKREEKQKAMEDNIFEMIRLSKDLALSKGELMELIEFIYGGEENGK